MKSISAVNQITVNKSESAVYEGSGVSQSNLLRMHGDKHNTPMDLLRKRTSMVLAAAGLSLCMTFAIAGCGKIPVEAYPGPYKVVQISPSDFGKKFGSKLSAGYIATLEENGFPQEDLKLLTKKKVECINNGDTFVFINAQGNVTAFYQNVNLNSEKTHVCLNVNGKNNTENENNYTSAYVNYLLVYDEEQSNVYNVGPVNSSGTINNTGNEGPVYIFSSDGSVGLAKSYEDFASSTSSEFIQSDDGVSISSADGGSGSVDGSGDGGGGDASDGGDVSGGGD